MSGEIVVALLLYYKKYKFIGHPVLLFFLSWYRNFKNNYGVFFGLYSCNFFSLYSCTYVFSFSIRPKAISLVI